MPFSKPRTSMTSCGGELNVEVNCQRIVLIYLETVY